MNCSNIIVFGISHYGSTSRTDLVSLNVSSFILIDYLKDKLDKYMSQFPKVRILRLKERHGLIRARLAGAQNATGKKLLIIHFLCILLYIKMFSKHKGNLKE